MSVHDSDTHTHTHTHACVSQLVETPTNNRNTPFEFTEENKLKIKQIIAKYPPGNQKSAVMPILDLAQRYRAPTTPTSSLSSSLPLSSSPVLHQRLP
jgi:NADH:ubiquinone oxidoreductase subunit E